MVSDGMGPASLSLTRSFRQFRDNLNYDDILLLDKHQIGVSRTRSNNSLVTDSAAGADVFSCGLKSYNGAIGVDPFKNPCGTVLEAAKLDGYKTGLVVTTRITDATPAAFSAHVDYRFQEDQIAEHQLGYYPLGRVVDLIIGGGRCHFYPRNTHTPFNDGFGDAGCRADNRNLIQEAINDGWSYVGDRAGFDSLQDGNNVTFPLLALLADTDIPYDIDRNSSIHPSLAEQTLTALTALENATKDSDKGFFILIEGSRIDHAGHDNDPAAQVREVLAYDDAFKVAKDFADNSDVETIILSTSDHETGGLATTRQVSPSYPDYLWYPEVLLNASHSGEYTSAHLRESSLKLSNLEDLKNFVVNEILHKDLGIKNPSNEEINYLIKHATTARYFLNNMVSFRSQTGWSTHGHSAVDVNVYGYSNTDSGLIKIYNALAGNHENTEIGQFMANYLELDLSSVTQKIKDTVHSPRIKQDELSLDSDDTLIDNHEHHHVY
ncbi:alkaline phosphatase PHO8 [Ascoidea rubescens DSM 1968]|uniref:alkaline phosphatase n=1 Tax=Ascoidea rubescens DSM 1968 TaxID=1344418 RepID=A0A1D2VSI5_9ASCO|nr:alkaline phosphatase-like protein [Ascoidea rubescens DSM 1968]ODV64566.1 alkaline phosphatase-like protein [Ascoidea rubescens DSM 1968]